ncbi:MAG TPA: amino acid adenylation domain-containing protein, partial [Thermoanaerobaculia bacterium]|nr:amino acid adenylation domain-containing protein [Thermoanaerobaculia bacterium]
MLHAAFEAQAGSTPNAVAAISADRRLIYAELEARANRLARHLQALGVGPEVRVGLCLDRDEQLLVSVLAVLKAGGAYVPLDPAYPPERLGFLLADSRAPLLITQQALVPVLPRHDAQVVLLDTDAFGSYSPERPSCRALSQNLAYFIYTSGSTGRPKGVAISHQSATALVRWALGVFSPEDLAGVALATSLCFDLSVFEIFAPLSAGGTVILAANALEIPHLPAAGEVTLINTVPSAMAELVRLGAVPPSVRVVNLAGEALPGALADAIYRTTTAQRVYNLYGPSEDTTYSTWALVAPGADIEPPIGCPIDGTRAWLVEGEIFLGGTGLARGYFDRPDLTAERFVPDPFSGEPGARLYRTGDLARELPDGNLHYLGRVDHQVKIRGFRIELGEIEAVLLRHPAVREAVAVARETPAGKQLVAYLSADPPPSAAELREHLLRTLPEHMAPAAFVRLEALPRTANGKVDRRALPEPDRESAGLETECVAPRTPVEERLAALFRELLQVEPGVHDDFFALGGHSLLAGQLVSRVRSELGVELPLRDIYRCPTLAGLAERVAVANRAERPRIERAPRDQPIPLSFQQERVWFLNELAPGGNIAYNFQATIRFRGPLRPDVLQAAMTEVLRRHEIFRTRFPAVDGVPVQEPLPPFQASLPVIDLGALPADRMEEEAEALIVRELRRPFDLLQAPLVRWHLLRRGPEDFTLVQVEHHFVHDGWSFARLLLEIRDLYRAFADGLPSPLPEPPIQYADYAVWQRSWMQGEALQRHIDHWAQVLDGAPPWLDLPSDRPRPPVQSFRGAILDNWVDPGLGWRLRAFARERGATLFTTMFAGFSLLMHRLSG